MSEQRNNDQQQGNEATIRNLKRLRQIASEQDRQEFVDAINSALKALGDDQGEDKSDGLRLSGSASDQLIQLAQQVRDTTLTPTQRTAAAHRLVRYGGGR